MPLFLAPFAPLRGASCFSPVPGRKTDFINASLRAETYKSKRRAPAGDGYAVPKEAASACDKSNSIHIGQCSRKALRIAIVVNVLPVFDQQGNSKRNDSAAVLEDLSRL